MSPGVCICNVPRCVHVRMQCQVCACAHAMPGVCMCICNARCVHVRMQCQVCACAHAMPGVCMCICSSKVVLFLGYLVTKGFTHVRKYKSCSEKVPPPHFCIWKQHVALISAQQWSRNRLLIIVNENKWSISEYR